MRCSYETKEAMTFIGYHTKIRPEEAYQKCPEFWDREYSLRFAGLWESMRPANALEKAILENRIGMYGICADAEDGFTYWIAGLYQGGEVPEGLDLIAFPAGRWAVFTAKGPIPASLQALNTAVWQEWYPAEGQRQGADGSVNLEVYSEGDPRAEDYESAIWMPVRKEG